MEVYNDPSGGVHLTCTVRKHLKGFLESGVQEDAATNMKVSITPGHYAFLEPQEGGGGGGGALYLPRLP